MGSLLRAWLDLEQRFHPHVAATSPFRVSTADFLGAMWLPVATTALYIAAFSYGIRRMEKQNPWDMKRLFILSKFAELADTAFIVLRKKRLSSSTGTTT
ncbi:very-long-chain 3-ketoacyl-CoA synthase [Aureococcus anophagefferens]|nr:very-long-chain 3-ketoacyl-CoA synthase [Aureococcus anophagefferens]